MSKPPTTDCWVTSGSLSDVLVLNWAPPGRSPGKLTRRLSKSLVGYLNLLLMEKIVHQLIWRIYHCLQGFMHLRWCRMFSINSISLVVPTRFKLIASWDGSLSSSLSRANHEKSIEIQFQNDGFWMLTCHHPGWR